MIAYRRDMIAFLRDRLSEASTWRCMGHAMLFLELAPGAPVWQRIAVFWLGLTFYLIAALIPDPAIPLHSGAEAAGASGP